MKPYFCLLVQWLGSTFPELLFHKLLWIPKASLSLCAAVLGLRASLLGTRCHKTRLAPECPGSFPTRWTESCSQRERTGTRRELRRGSARGWRSLERQRWQLLPCKVLTLPLPPVRPLREAAAGEERWPYRAWCAPGPRRSLGHSGSSRRRCSDTPPGTYIQHRWLRNTLLNTGISLEGGNEP